VATAPVPPAIGASPTALSFTATQGGANPATQAMTISNTGGGTLSWSASEAVSWLTLSPASGTGNGTVTLSATTGTLTANTYSTMVTLSAGTGVTPVTVPVTFTVATAPVPPAIGASPTALSFTATQGGANPATQAMTISNTGGGTLSWSASEAVSWLTLSPASGTGNGTVTLSATTGTLTANTYSTMVTLSAGTGVTPVTVPVTFTVATAPVPPAIGASPTALSFTATQGGANPATQAMTISNTGGGTLSWSASEAVSWLTLSPASGTGNGTVTLSATTGTLTANTYSTMVTLSAGTGVTPVTVPVTFTVATAPTISISPPSLSYTATQGAANPASQSAAVSSNQAWTASDNASWLTVSPTSGSNSGPITVSVNTATAALGANTALITVTGGGITQTITVTLMLNAPSTSSATLTWTPNTEPDLASYRVYRSSIQGVYGPVIMTVPAGTASYTATGLQVGQTYYFTITAVDAANNESIHSNEVSKSIF
jgi:hypothetical protein